MLYYHRIPYTKWLISDSRPDFGGRSSFTTFYEVDIYTRYGLMTLNFMTCIARGHGRFDQL